MKKPSVLISIPCYEHKVYWQTMRSMWSLGYYMHKMPFEPELDIYANCFITNARNSAANEVLSNKRIEGLLFIDADMGFEVTDVLKLYAWMKKGFWIVGGNYTFKRISWEMVEQAVKAGLPTEDLKHYNAHMVSALLPEDQQPHVNIKEVDYLGMGLTFIHRKVLEGIVEQFPDSWHVFPDGEKTYEFFKVGKNEIGYHHTEDAYFCNLAAKAGFKSWWPVDVRPSHIGVVSFDPAKALPEQTDPEIPEESTS